jgi:hypothetical protein
LTSGVARRCLTIQDWGMGREMGSFKFAVSYWVAV